MIGTSGNSGMEAQRRISEFFHAELLHSLGVYNGASQGLEALLGQLTEVSSAPEDVADWQLKRAAEASLHSNCQLRDQLHHASTGSRSRGRPSPFPAGEESAYPTVGLLHAIADFYEGGIAALECHLRDPDAGRDATGEPGYVLGLRLAFVQDPHRRREGLTEEENAALVRGKIDRYSSRLEAVTSQMPAGERDGRAPLDEASKEARFYAILRGRDADDIPQSLLPRIIQAMSEAHLWMHEAESVQSQSFGQMLTSVPETHVRAQGMLRYSHILNTFVYMAARATPWIFAEDDVEREYVIAKHETCVKTLAPTYCLWLSTQCSLLALHRRAFTWWTMGKREWAYRDFHKLIRLLRGLRTPAARRGLRVPGTNTFVEGLMAMAELHIGRIYRRQHAHRMAIRYFDRASLHLNGWEEHGEVGELVKSSHWRVNLLLNQGKANFQLGKVKRSIHFYALAWRAYLLLVEMEAHTTANLDVVDAFTGWLEKIVDDPDLERSVLRAKVEPLVDQIATLRSPPHLRTLAAEIVMRLGHLLFVLKLPPAERECECEDPRKAEPGARTEPPDGKHDLAAVCLAKAVFLDPTSTLTMTDLLKLEQDTRKAVDRPDDAPKRAGEMRIGEQWPAVTGGFKEAAQVTEYILQYWLKEVTEDASVPRSKEEDVGLALMKSFIAHSDSSNVKLAQVYRYLMQQPREDAVDKENGYSLNFICMRRYSSFFPFLPRPSAFRAPGGGYFVQVTEPLGKPFGIVVDPGPDFIENLYRCGYSLADIHMIVVTHDHADHLASLDALLAVMFNRGRLARNPFSRKLNRRLAIVGNKSVRRRYAFFNRKSRKGVNKNEKERTREDAVRVLSFSQISELTRPRDRAERRKGIEAKGIVLEPETLWIEPVRTWGHLDAHGYPSQGFLLHFGEGADRSSILFTGDTGAPADLVQKPDLERARRDDLFAGKAGDKGLRMAIEEADVIVAHLSAVPLYDLRLLAGMHPGGRNDLDLELIDDYQQLWAEAAREVSTDTDDAELQAGIEEADFLLKQIQFGFRVKAAHHPEVEVSPFDSRQRESPPEKHLFLKGLLEIAEIMAAAPRARGQLLLLGELREELGTFRTSIATSISKAFFEDIEGSAKPTALTADIGLRVRLGSGGTTKSPITVLCTTCDLDNDLVATERFHPPNEISEVCVKGEDEGVFYNCLLHDPRMRDEFLWVESVERYDLFGD
jgi:hypothetical protein